MTRSNLQKNAMTSMLTKKKLLLIHLKETLLRSSKQPSLVSLKAKTSKTSWKKKSKRMFLRQWFKSMICLQDNYYMKLIIGSIFDKYTFFVIFLYGGHTCNSFYICHV